MSQTQNQEQNSGLDKLSWLSLLFLVERTDFSEPWVGFGIPSAVKKEILAAARRKADKLDKQAIEDNPHWKGLEGLNHKTLEKMMKANSTIQYGD